MVTFSTFHPISFYPLHCFSHVQHLFPFLSPDHCLLALTEPLQAMPLCLKQELSPEVTSTSPSPSMAASTLAYVELQALQKPVSVSSSCNGPGSSSNPYPNAFNSFSHHAPMYGQFSSQSLMSGNSPIHLFYVHSFSFPRHFLIIVRHVG